MYTNTCVTKATAYAFDGSVISLTVENETISLPPGPDRHGMVWLTYNIRPETISKVCEQTLRWS